MLGLTFYTFWPNLRCTVRNMLCTIFLITIKSGLTYMKSDALTIAAIVFLLGMLATGLGLTDWKRDSVDEPTDLQRGFAVSNQD